MNEPNRKMRGITSNEVSCKRLRKHGAKRETAFRSGIRGCSSQIQERRPQARIARAGLLGGFLEHFGIDGDGDIVTNNHAAVVHGGIPLHAEILAIDLRGSVDGDALIAPGVFYWSARTIHIESDFFGD